ncbi:hypothetical protein U9K52_13390 [Chryseobacterium sp. MHB01]|uniref:hypothetical protein n=1 Tax=Chryseobacterium sp. MHB01 TaxID=3109433 RepID=UPI002AFE5E11|nr:hypothetical protein [Chryseobacterium sp. MHB01]MEA1849912.1 hypothetical protein [Chryseobacterium sp. MHB01]
MIETEIAITVNRKSDIDLIEQKIIENKIMFPVYIREYEFSYQINFTSDYEQWELDTAILSTFPGYEYTKDLERGRKEIRIQISRYQSELSTDGWGRPIENPLNETKYLVKSSVHKAEKFSPKIKVLFEDKEQYYFINIIGGTNRATEENGFLLLDHFTSNKTDDATFFKDRLYKSPLDAFHSGYYKLAEVVDKDFNTYIENKKKEIRAIQKLPRKIIRDFINACNSSDISSILKNLDENVVFRVRKNWQTISEIEGLSTFRQYLDSSEQQLCGKDFKIRSSWSFSLPNVTIGVKYFPPPTEQNMHPFQKYEHVKFLLDNNKIVSILYEC